MTRLPCPSWCVTDHQAEDATRDFVLDDLTEHTGVDVSVPVRTFDGGDDPSHAVSVSLTMVDNVHSGRRGPAGVWLQAGGQELSPENALSFGLAVLNAACVAASGRLDSLVAAELDRLCGGGERP